MPVTYNAYLDIKLFETSRYESNMKLYVKYY